MTVENPNVKNTYAGNGSTTVFPFTFQLNPEDVNNVFVTLSNEEGTEIEQIFCCLSVIRVCAIQRGGHRPWRTGGRLPFIGNFRTHKHSI